MEEQRLLEAKIIYGLIQTNEAITDVFEIVDIDDFKNFARSAQIILDLHAKSRPVEFDTVLAYDKQIKEAVNEALSDEFSFITVPDKEALVERARILKELSVRQQIGSSLYTFDMATIQKKLESVYKRGLGRWVTGKELRDLAASILNHKKRTTTTYGIEILDNATGGIHRGQYIIVAGRPSVGKSAFLQHIALHNAEKGKKVLFVSIEMSEEMVTMRLLSHYSGTSAFDEDNDVTHGIDKIPDTFNILTTTSIQGVESEIRNKARDFDLVCIDYIQLMQSDAKTRDMYERVTNLSGAIKRMCTQFNLPMVVASQYARRADKVQPSMADLKESGALEQDADVVISLYKTPGDSELVVSDHDAVLRLDLLKNRNGWTFSNSEEKEYKVLFRRNIFSFKDM